VQSAPAITLCAGSTPPDSSAICVKTDTRSLAYRTCCGYGTCGSTGHGNHLKTLYIVLIRLAAALVVIGIVVAGFCWRRHHKENSEPPFPPYREWRRFCSGGLTIEDHCMRLYDRKCAFTLIENTMYQGVVFCTCVGNEAGWLTSSQFPTHPICYTCTLRWEGIGGAVTYQIFSQRCPVHCLLVEEIQILWDGITTAANS
jgi:hypothetical protein